MADAITIAQLIEASEDATSLSNFMFQPSGYMVDRRLAPAINTLQYYVDYMDSLAAGKDGGSATIESLTVESGEAGTNASVVTGGTSLARTFLLTIPRGDKGIDGSYTLKAYSTYDLMTADGANIPANTSVNVTNDTDTTKNGMYSYDGTDFAKSAYDPLSLSKDYTVSYVDDLANSLAEPKPYEIIKLSKNIFNVDDIINDSYISNAGVIKAATGWARSPMIAVIAGQTYTLSGTRTQRGMSFFANNTDTSPVSYIDDATMPITVTAPTGANYVSFNIHTATDNNYSNLMLQEGGVATDYDVFGSNEVKIDASFISGSLVTEVDIAAKSKFTVLDNNAARITTVSDINLQLDLLLTKPSTHNNSTVFNFAVDKVDGTTVRTINDDVAPLRADNTTIGANHGYNRTEITATHDKGAIDVGSIWTDGTKEFVLIDVPSSTVLSVTSRTDNASLQASSLSYVSGATNSATIDATTKSYKQWYPAIKNRSLKTVVDGTVIDLNVLHEYDYSESVAFHESYEIMAKTDIVEWIIANGGTNLAEYDAPPSILCNYSYVFDVDGGCTIYASITAYKSIPFADWMLTQSQIMTTGNVSYYVPKTVAFNQDSIDYNFSQLQPVSAPLPSSVYFNASKQEANTYPVDRLLQFSNDVGYATGYLPVYDTAPDVRAVNASNKYLEIRNSSLKIYPSVIDGLQTTLESGDSFTSIGYRKYFKRNTERTSQYTVRSNVGDFLYLDWHTAKTDIISLPDDLIGRNFVVHEQSSNVTLLSKFATNNIVVTIDDTKSYGYLVLQFDN